jgi:hypothetical protein
MAERITEAELREVESLTAFDGPVRQHAAQRLVAEVRRLRSLVTAVATLHKSMDTVDEDGRDYEQGVCLWCGLGLEEGRSYESTHLSDCAWSAVRAEARAIRSE